MGPRKEPTRPYEAFAVNLAKARLDANLTQEHLAFLADLSPRHYQGLEAGIRCPSLDTLVQLQAVLKCSLDDFAKGMKARKGTPSQNKRSVRRAHILSFSSLPPEPPRTPRRGIDR